MVDNFTFFDGAGNILDYMSTDMYSSVAKVRIAWCIQKNHQNGQDITLSAAHKCPQICLVCAALQMVLQACCLGQPDSLPVACHTARKNIRAYMTASCISVFIQKAGKTVHTDLESNNDKLSK